MPELMRENGKIYYEVHGEAGPWLVFVAGLGGLGGFWKAQVQAFSSSFRVLVHDHRGCGRSESTVASCSIKQLSDDLSAILDAVAARDIVLIGHSMGGMIAQNVAIEQPYRIRALVLSGAFGRMDRYMVMMNDLRQRVLSELGTAEYCRLTFLLSRSAKEISSLSDDDIAGMMTRSIAVVPPVELAMSRMRATLPFDRMDELRHLVVPTLVIGAADDLLAPDYHSRDLADCLSHARLEILDRGGHFFPAQRPAEYNRILSDFLQAQALS